MIALMAIAAFLGVINLSVVDRDASPTPTPAVVVVREVFEVRTVVEVTATPTATPDPNPASTLVALAEPTWQPTKDWTPTPTAACDGQFQPGDEVTHADGRVYRMLTSCGWEYVGKPRSPEGCVNFHYEERAYDGDPTTPDGRVKVCDD